MSPCINGLLEAYRIIGSITLLPQHSSSKLALKYWSEFTCSSNTFASSSPGPASSRFFHIRTALSQTCDSIKTGSNILFQATKVTYNLVPLKSLTMLITSKFGRVRALFGCILPTGTTVYYVSVEQYSTFAEKHHIFDMPVLDLNGDIVTVPVEVRRSTEICMPKLSHIFCRISLASLTFSTIVLLRASVPYGV